MPLGKTDPEAIPFNKLKGEFLVIEEKLDGTGVSIFFDHNYDPCINHRGSRATGAEFKTLYDWVDHHEDELFDLVGDRYFMFGEWMLHKHTIFYDKLPAYFLESDIYDKHNNIFLSTLGRFNLLFTFPFIESVPILASLKPSSLEQITGLVSNSLYHSDEWEDLLKSKCMEQSVSFGKTIKETDCSGLSEGLYIKHEDDDKIIGRYKYVRYEFVQNILDSGSHLRDRLPIHNVLSEHTNI